MINYKYRGKETNLKSALASTIVTWFIKIMLVLLMYKTFKSTYITNEYLTIILTLIGLNLIDSLHVELTWK